MMILAEFLKLAKHDKLKSIDFFCDIETFQYNEIAGYKHPSDFKNQVWSVAVGWYYQDELFYFYAPAFNDFFDIIEQAKLSMQTKINLIFHNGNKFDNHYLLMQLVHDYPSITRRSMHQTQALENINTATFKSLSKHKGDQIILEKRVKSKSSVELKFTLGTVTYQTVDTLPKFNMSLGTIGKKLHDLSLVTENELKTTLDYEKYSRGEDLDYTTTLLIARRIHANLTPQEMHYIKNDIVILAKAWRYFDLLLPNFDRDKITFSQNVLDEYKVSPLATYQLTGKLGKMNINYSEFNFRGENYSDFMKHFYRGGLNFYNDRYIAKDITSGVYSYDLNSSYPTVMYNNKFPTYLVNASDTPQTMTLDLTNQNRYDLLEISVTTFNELLADIPSKNIRKALVKYYTSIYQNVYINTNTIRLMNLFNNHLITELPVISYQQWACEPFGARNVIAENYAIKSQGKNKYVINADDPTDIKITNEINKHPYSIAEYNNSKILLNSIYGLPALRPFYNLYLYNPENSEIESYPNSFKNSERNQIFSIYLTSQALINLLTPLVTLSADEIDRYWYYADTDSLYIGEAVDDKIDKTLFNDFNLGYWKREHHMSHFYILNHKKYAYYDDEKQDIGIRSGGVSKDAFNTDMAFDEFIRTQFSAGATLPSTKSTLTKSGTLAIYQSKIILDVGKPYQIEMKDENKAILNLIAKKAKHDIIEMDTDAMYIETPWGSLSVNEVMGVKHPKADDNILQLIGFMQGVKNRLGGE